MMFENCPAYLTHIGVLAVWDSYQIEYGSITGLIEIDSCIDNTHPALQFNKDKFVEKIDQCIFVKPKREDFQDVEAFNKASKNFPHGTSVAGIILARPGIYNNIMVCGVDLSGNSRIFAYDAFSTTSLVNLLENALDKENLSDAEIKHFSRNNKEIWRSYTKNTIISTASLGQELSLTQKEWSDIVDIHCTNTKIILIAAAGNDSVDLEDHKDKYFPANLRFSGRCQDFLIRVGSVEYNKSGIPQKAAHSNFGKNILDIMAPGKDIPVIQPNSGATIGDGTSYATPIVTAAVSMMLRCKPNANSADIKDSLFESADKYKHLEALVKEGRVLNVKKAVDSFCKRSVGNKPSLTINEKKEEL